MPSRTGTASQVDGSGGNGSTTVTVPGDANLAVAFWAMWDTDNSISSLTLNGASFAIVEQLGTSGSAPGTGIAVLENPATGSQTFAWNYAINHGLSEGGGIFVVYVTGANIGDAVRDTALDQQVGGDATSATATSLTTDLVLGLAQSFGTNPGANGTIFIDDANVNSETYDVTELTAGDPSTTLTVANPNYSTAAVISLKAAAAAAAVGLVGRGLTQSILLYPRSLVG